MFLLVPVVLAFTALLSWLLLGNGHGQQHQADLSALADNFTRYHWRAWDAATHDAALTGTVTVTMPRPFVDLGEWTSYVGLSPDGTTRIVVTWAVNYDQSQRYTNQDLQTLVALIQDAGTVDDSLIGVAYSGSVGDWTLPTATNALIPDGTPVLVTPTGEAP